MLNQYEKNGLKRVHPELYSLLQTLDMMAGAYNKIWLQRYEEAMADFSTVDLLPMKKQDLPSQKAKLYESQWVPSDLRALLLDCVITQGRLVLHIHYKVSNETNRFQDTSKAAETKYSQLEEYKDLLNRLVLYLDLVLRSPATQAEPDKVQRITEVAMECKRI